MSSGGYSRPPLSRTRGGITRRDGTAVLEPEAPIYMSGFGEKSIRLAARIATGICACSRTRISYGSTENLAAAQRLWVASANGAAPLLAPTAVRIFSDLSSELDMIRIMLSPLARSLPLGFFAFGTGRSC
jgi:hypothetical protein